MICNTDIFESSINYIDNTQPISKMSNYTQTTGTSEIQKDWRGQVSRAKIFSLVINLLI